MVNATKSVRISQVVLLGETGPTYFIDLVKGRDCRNLRSTKDANEAFRIADSMAENYGVMVVNS